MRVNSSSSFSERLRHSPDVRLALAFLVSGKAVCGRGMEDRHGTFKAVSAVRKLRGISMGNRPTQLR